MLHYINMLHSHPHRETELEALSHWRLRDQAELDSSQIGVTHSAAVTRKPYCPQGSGVTQQKKGEAGRAGEAVGSPDHPLELLAPGRPAEGALQPARHLLQ